jgi:hypothetical protein
MPLINIAANLAVSTDLSNCLAAALRRESMILRAELIGDYTCAGQSMTVRAKAPVLTLCRLLLAQGYDPTTTLDVYRGNTVCLRVRSIGEGSGLTVENSRFRRVASAAGTAKRSGSTLKPLKGAAYERTYPHVCVEGRKA